MLRAYVPRHARVVPPAAHHATRRKQVPVDPSRKLRVMAPAAALLRAAANIPQPNLPRQRHRKASRREVKCGAVALIPKCRSCSSGDGWQHAGSIAAASPRTRAPAAAQGELARCTRAAAASTCTGAFASMRKSHILMLRAETLRSQITRSAGASAGCSPAIHGAGRNAERVVLVPVAAQNLCICKNIG